MTAQEIINKNPNMRRDIAESMVEIEKFTGRPYGEIMDKLVARYGKPMSIIEFCLGK